MLISQKILWSCFNFIAASCSIAGIFALFFQQNEYFAEITIGFVFLVLLIAFIGQLIRRSYRMKVVTRKAIIDTGISLIKGTKNRVVMFAGDMTWIDDYASTIRGITDQGKLVHVFHRRSSAFTVQRNADLLRSLGATCSSVPYESSIRGMFIDPEDSEDGFLFVTDRRLRSGGQSVDIGEKSKDENYRYFAKIYYMSEDPKILNSIRDYIDILHNGN